MVILKVETWQVRPSRHKFLIYHCPIPLRTKWADIMPQFFHRMKYLYFLYIIRNFHSLTRISVHCDIQKPFICMYFNCTKAIHFRHFPTGFRLEIPRSSTFFDRKRWYFPVDEITHKMSSELFKNYCCKKSDDPISFLVEKVIYL